MSHTNLPRHIGIIMDGNGRWAKQRGLPRPVGHRHGVKAVRKAIDHCNAVGIEYLTLYVFSSENWQRPETEVSLLMSLFVEMMKKELKNLAQKNARILFLGNDRHLPRDVKKTLFESIEKTRSNTGLKLQLAISYSGRDEIVEAARSIAEAKIPPGEITEKTVQQHLFQPQTPDPELIIRTGGTFRLSNFLIWQSAYAELFFSDRLWPDFDENELDRALEDFSSRERRFGRVQ
ncbi:MAG: isoprenyl transferase [Fibrobacterota bacterium]